MSATRFVHTDRLLFQHNNVSWSIWLFVYTFKYLCYSVCIKFECSQPRPILECSWWKHYFVFQVSKFSDQAEAAV